MSNTGSGCSWRRHCMPLLYCMVILQTRPSIRENLTLSRSHEPLPAGMSSGIWLPTNHDRSQFSRPCCSIACIWHLGTSSPAIREHRGYQEASPADSSTRGYNIMWVQGYCRGITIYIYTLLALTFCLGASETLQTRRRPVYIYSILLCLHSSECTHISRSEQHLRHDVAAAANEGK